MFSTVQTGTQVSSCINCIVPSARTREFLLWASPAFSFFSFLSSSCYRKYREAESQVNKLCYPVDDPLTGVAGDVDPKGKRSVSFKG